MHSFGYKTRKTLIIANSKMPVPSTLLNSPYMQQVLYFLHFADIDNEA